MPKPLTAANLYNPHEQSKEQLIERFVVRQDVFTQLYQEIKTSDMSIPGSHYLIEGQRGTGKTTLLLRLNYAIEDDTALQARLMSIVFKEEAYYGIRRLYALWRTIAQELELRHREFKGLPERMRQAYDQACQPIFHERHYEKICFDLLLDALESQPRKLILFIDNFGELLYNFTGQELYRLYKMLKECPSILLIGASSIALEALISDEDGFFYTLFEKKRLESLNKHETYTLLRELARTYDKEAVIQKLIKRQPGRIESLRILTGGVIRTIVLLFEIFTEQEADNTLADLDTVLDKVTPLYKHRMDILSPLQREIVNTIALNWEALSLDEIAKTTLLHPEEVMLILQDLEYVFLIERIGSDPQRSLYRLRERFFNIWYLMRLSLGNGQARVAWVVRFLESWYNKTELTRVAQKYAKSVSSGRCQPESAFYLTEAFVKTGILDQNLEHQIVSATKKLLQATNRRLAEKSSLSDRELLKKGERYYQQENYTKAIPCFLKLKQKDERIYFRLGYAFNKLSRYTQAITYFLLAAKRGHVEAMLHLGMLYDYHFHDYSNAKKYYSLAAEKGHTDAMLNLGNLYYHMFDNYSQARKYFLMAVKAVRERSDVLTSDNFSLKYLKNYLVTAIKGNVTNPEQYEIQDFPGAQKDYLQAMKQTASEAMFQLGNLHTEHLRDVEKAQKYYRMAAESGHVKAMVQLGDLYHYTLQEYKQAERYYSMAVRKSDIDALVNLGILYHDIFQQYNKAEKCYTLAAEKGNIKAIHGLACLYLQQKREKQKALYYAMELLEAEKNIQTAHIAACIYLWNDSPQEACNIAERFMFSYDAYEILGKDMLFYLMLLIAKQQYRQALHYFQISGSELHERFAPLYYALLYFVNDLGYQKLPPELTEPVQDIIQRINRMTVEYA